MPNLVPKSHKQGRITLERGTIRLAVQILNHECHGTEKKEATRVITWPPQNCRGFLVILPWRPDSNRRLARKHSVGRLLLFIEQQVCVRIERDPRT